MEGDGLLIRHVDDVPWQEVRAQQHGARRASVWNRFVDVAAARTVVHTRYDPGVVLARHWHHSDEVILVLEGELMVGEQRCTSGSVIVLNAGAAFGPLIAGERGVVLFEVFTGPAARAGHDEASFRELLRERGIDELPTPAFDVPAPRA